MEIGDQNLAARVRIGIGMGLDEDIRAGDVKPRIRRIELYRDQSGIASAVGFI